MENYVSALRNEKDKDSCVVITQSLAFSKSK